MPVTVEKAPYGGWANCYRVSNGKIDLIVTADVGPRVIRFGFAGSPNEFGELAEQIGKTGGDDFRPYGGHRLWHSPETKARTYFPDNQPVGIEARRDGIEAAAPIETNSGIKKSLVLTMSPDKPEVIVEHHLKNEGVWPVEMAVWCISVMATGGVSVVPQSAEGDEEGLLPNRSITLWPYTDMTDPRFTWGGKLVRLQYDNRPKTKYGMPVTAGWGAYVNRGHLFLKEFQYEEDALYPDGGCSIEVYTDERILELESLSPLHLVEPGETISHTEAWSLHDGFVLPGDDTKAIEAIGKLLGA